jgi:hypothetical protein
MNTLKSTDYRNNGRCITEPGKFEGCPIFAPYFWEAGLSGFADEDDGERYVFRITPEERKESAVLDQYLGRNQKVLLWEDSQGFVHCA